MLEELAIAEEKELTNAGDSLDNIQWNDFANKQQSFTFTGKSGLLMDLPSNISPGEVLSLFLGEKVINLLVTETKIWEFLVRELMYSENTRPDNERKKTKKVSHHLEIQRISRASLLEGALCSETLSGALIYGTAGGTCSIFEEKTQQEDYGRAGSLELEGRVTRRLCPCASQWRTACHSPCGILSGEILENIQTKRVALTLRPKDL
ncbi:hypothetical protein K0M31_002194 [Melipona bicolor]|uniref:Uncharacterized protein n=1 Tax=Melipona bicolor TaxID=60889 RepID=A0AA40GH21_9HYME|nr:hypothetical protein K0M31_002194 [Melipona bicolor]